MTFHLNPIVHTDFPIVCACCIKLGTPGDEEVLLVRSDGTIEIGNCVNLKNTNLTKVVAATSVGEHSAFALLNNEESISLYKIVSGKTIRLFSTLESHYLSRPPVGVSFEKFNVDFLYRPNELVYRIDRIERNMSSDLRAHRRYLPVTKIIVDHDKMTEKSVCDVDGIHVSTCLFLDITIVILTKSRSPENIHLYSVRILAAHTVDNLPVPGQLGPAVASVTSQGNKILVLSPLGVAVFQETGLKHVLMFPDSSAIIPLSDAPKRAASPKLHPALTLFRKYSEVQTPSLLVESILHLSLGDKTSSFPDNRRGELVLPSRDDSYAVLPHTWICGHEKLCVIANKSSLHVFDLHAATPTQKARALRVDFVDKVLSTGKYLHLISGSKIFKIDTDAYQFDDVISNSGSSTVLSVFQLETTISLTDEALRFSFRNSIKCNLIFQTSCNINLHPFCALSPDLLCVFFPHGEARMFRIHQTSPQSSAASFENKTELTLPIPSFFEVSEIRSSLQTELETVGIIMRGDNKALIQITRNSVFANGISFLSRSDACIIAFSDFRENLYALYSDGVLMGQHRQLSTSVNDPTCFAVITESRFLIGDFDGFLHFSPQSLSFKVANSAIECIQLCSSERVLISTRSDGLFIVSLENLGLKILKKIEIYDCIKLTVLRDDIYICYGIRMHLLDLRNTSERISTIELGQHGLISCVSAVPESNELLISIEGSLMKIQLDELSHVATYEKSLPIAPSTMTLVEEKDRYAEIYMLGYLKSLNQPALLVFRLDQSRVGLMGMNEALSLSALLPFTEEEPISICVWDHQMFQSSGLVVVGTRGRGKGRLILFDRPSMNALAKTSIPSPSIYSVSPLSAEFLAIGCEDCLAVLSLRPGQINMPLVLSTAAVYNTYSSVLFLTRVDDTRVLVVTENGCIQLISFRGDSCIREASPESAIRVVSSCVLVPDSSRFVCSSSTNDILIFNIDDGCLRVVQTIPVGARITSGYPNAGSLCIGLDNGSIVNLTDAHAHARIINRSS